MLTINILMVKKIEGYTVILDYINMTEKIIRKSQDPVQLSLARVSSMRTRMKHQTTRNLDAEKNRIVLVIVSKQV